MKRAAVVALALTLAVQTSSSTPLRREPVDHLPRLMLWAWERPVDLRGLGRGTGIAFLSQTITIATGRFTVQPRRQPLRVDDDARLVAVTRIESDRDGAGSLGDTQTDAIAASVARTANLPRVRAVQIDFDATTSERGFYRALLRTVRARLDPAVPLSITALASWCAGDDWLDDLPIDEAVPMLFRMGPTNEPFRALGRSGAWRAPLCRRALGVSLDEPIDARADGRRVYVFSPRPWTEALVVEARRGSGE